MLFLLLRGRFSVKLVIDEKENMITAAFDLQNIPEGYLADPYRVLAELRARSPVHENPDGTFILTSYNNIFQTYQDPIIWSSDKKAAFRPKF